MTICKCCGQTIASRTAELYTDPAVVLCARHAIELAASARSMTVDIAHFALALARSPEASQIIRETGRDPVALQALAQQYIQAREPGRSKDRPPASPEFLELLTRAEHWARENASDTITLQLVIETLATRCRDLAGTAFLRQPLASPASSNSAAEAIGRHRPQPESHFQTNSHRQHNRHAKPAAEFDAQTDETDQYRSSGNADPFQLRTDFSSQAGRRETARSTSGHSPTNHGGKQEHGRATAPTSVGTTRSDAGLHDRFDRIEAMLSERTYQPAREATNLSNASLTITPADIERLEYLLAQIRATENTRNNGKAKRQNNRSRTSQSSQNGSSSWIRTRNRSQSRLRTARRSHNRSPWMGDNTARRFPEVRENGDQDRTRSHRERLNRDNAHRRQDWNDDDVRTGITASEDDTATKRFYLELNDDIVRSPAIGPRTAERLKPLGIHIVRDLLAADPSDLAERVDARHISTGRIEDWQMQARLVLTIPWLRGTHAQLLVGAGYTTAADIQAASRNDLCADILKFAGTRDGQRILRAGPPPDVEKITAWAEFAEQAELERAA